jgi:hypothetical protein
MALSVAFVPIAAAVVIILIINNMARRVEDLLLKAADTGNWSSSWRSNFLARFGDRILVHSTSIQRRWLRQRRARSGWILPIFAAVFMHESIRSIRSYVAADREEPMRQLRELRNRARRGDR